MLRQALDYLSRTLRRSNESYSSQQQKKRIRLDVETLELRWLPAYTFDIASATYSVSETTRYLDIVINKSGSGSGGASVDYATSNGTAVAGSDFTSTSGTAPLGKSAASVTIRVPITDDDVSESNETFTFTLSNPVNGSLGSTTSATITITNSSPVWTAVGQQRYADPFQAFTQTFGTATYTQQTGDLSLSHGFDYGQGGAVFNQPSLVYHSDTTSVLPIVQALVTPTSPDDTINDVQVRLTWNSGSPQSWVTYNPPSGTDPLWTFGSQVSTPVTSTGLYPYSIDVVFVFAHSGNITRTVTGNAIVVVNDGDFGKGWNISGFDHLVSVSGGMLYVYGSGGARLFTGSGGTYTNPANDQGTLVKNGDNTYTYTDKHQQVWNFDTSGNLVTMVEPHGLTRTFTYSSGDLVKVTEPDGGITTFTYSSGKLATIVQPGNRTITVTIDGSSKLTNIADADGSLRTFTYDANIDLTNEKWGLLNTTFSYDGTTALLTGLNRGSGVTQSLNSSYGASLSTTSPLTQTDSNLQTSTVVDALSRTGTFTLDIQGRLINFISEVAKVRVSEIGEIFGDYDYTTIEGGIQSTYTRNAAGNVTVYVNSLGGVFTYTYDGNQNLLNMQRPDNSRVTFTYDGTFNFITSKKDSLNHLTTYTYNGTGDLTSIQDALTNRTTYTYTNGLVETVKDALSNVTTYTYDGNRRVQSIIDPLGNRTTYTYDASGNVATVKDALNRVTTSTYDAKHRTLTTTNAINGVTTYAYNAQGQPTSVTDPLGVTTSFIYDAQGRQTQRVDAVGTGLQRTTTFAYDVSDQLSTVVDALNHTTTYNMTSGGWKQTETNPLNLTTSYTYNGFGEVTSVIDPLNHIVTSTYDNQGRLLSVQNALGNLTTFTYDTEGNRLTSTDANNGVTTYSYDALNRVVAAADPLNHTSTTVFDAVGNVLATVNALGNRTTFSYDAANRQITMKDSLTNVTTYSYDAVGNLVTVKDALTNVTTYVYDDLNRRVNTIEPNGSKTTIVYDAVGHMTGLIDPNSNRTTFVFDALGRQTQEITALNKTITYTYNAIDQLTQKKDRKSQTIDYSYDNAGRLTGEVWKNSGGTTTNTQTFTYDNANHMLTASDSNGTYTFTYDANGQVLTQKDMWNTTLTFTYDNVGNRTKVQDSFSGVETSVYDAANNLTSRKFGGIGGTSQRLDFTYTAINQMENVKRYNASSGGSLTSQTTYTYDTFGNVTGIKNADGSASVLSQYTYTYDVGNRLSTETLAGSTKTYTYDSRSQVTGDGTTTYAYDNAGNRNNSGQTINTGNRLASDSTYNYTYDDEGNLVTKVSIALPATTVTYTWDVNNRLTSIDKYGVYNISYKYDVFGNRIEQVEDADGSGAGASVTTRFALEGSKIQQDAWGNRVAPVGTENWNIWADLSGSNSLQVRYVRGDATDELFSRVKSDGTVASYLTDRMGSVRQIADASGAVQDTIAYDGFGNVLSESNATFGDRWKWTGREVNSSTGLQYNRARYFSGDTGRWINDDPIRFLSGDNNLTRYSSNSTMQDADPSGLTQVPIVPPWTPPKGPRPPKPGQPGFPIFPPPVPKPGNRWYWVKDQNGIWILVEYPNVPGTTHPPVYPGGPVIVIPPVPAKPDPKYRRSFPTYPVPEWHEALPQNTDPWFPVPTEPAIPFYPRAVPRPPKSGHQTPDMHGN